MKSNQSSGLDFKITAKEMNQVAREPLSFNNTLIDHFSSTNENLTFERMGY